MPCMGWAARTGLPSPSSSPSCWPWAVVGRLLPNRGLLTAITTWLPSWLDWWLPARPLRRRPLMPGDPGSLPLLEEGLPGDRAPPCCCMRCW